MQPARTLRRVGAGRGAGLVGIGTRGLAPTLLCREMAYGIARSAGDFILRGGCLTRHSLDMGGDMAMAADATSITSGITVIGKRIHHTSRAKVTTMAFIAGRDRRVAVFTLDLAWLAFAALVGADTAGSTVADSMVAVAVAFTRVVDSTAAVVEGTGGKLEMTLRPVEAST